MNIIPSIIYVFVGIVSLSMAYKNLFSQRMIPFHEKAAGKALNELESGLQSVVVALMRVSGLGFFVVGIVLTLFPIVNYYHQNIFVQYAVPSISFCYCLGLSIFNYQLHSKTDVVTPWQKSLYAAMAILIGFMISIG